MEAARQGRGEEGRRGEGRKEGRVVVVVVGCKAHCLSSSFSLVDRRSWAISFSFSCPWDIGKNWTTIILV